MSVAKLKNMLKGFFHVPKAVNEPVKSYAPNSPEKTAVLEEYRKMWNSKIEVPLYIGSDEMHLKPKQNGQTLLGNNAQLFS